jgi:hypothetical protein
MQESFRIRIMPSFFITSADNPTHSPTISHVCQVVSMEEELEIRSADFHEIIQWKIPRKII